MNHEAHLDAFDAEWYLKEYPDVSQLNMDPVEHYLWLGRRLGRRPSPFAEPSALLIGPMRRVTMGVGMEEPIIWREKMTSGPSVAAIAHVYYPDLIDEVCAHLANIPYQFSGFFAVPNVEMTKAIRHALVRHGVDCKPHFAVTPNRGRNFGGFLVEFRKAIRAHDLCVHIHTKKSLRTGTEQRDWRSHLFDGLLGDRRKVATILACFADDQRVGLVYPVTYDVFPLWGHHWLSNAPRVDEISAMLGISGIPRRGLIDFPVGSMFWARTAAIAPLLDFEWNYDHFESEPIGADGSMAHVIEHVIGPLCTVSGFDTLEISYGEQIIRRNWNQKHLHRHKDAWEESCRIVQNCDVISFDFYDTLFCRHAFTPDDVHNYIGWVLHVRHGVMKEEEFYKFRKKAEEHARVHSGKGDVTLDDIYAAFPAVCDWPNASIVLARKLEWEIEARCLVPRGDVIELVRKAKANGARVIIISDSYMPRSFFEHVLSKHHLSNLFDELYISSEEGRRKDRGDIWPWLRTKEIEGRRYYHVGDNEHSDMQNAEGNGFGHVYLLNTTMLAQLSGLGPLQDWRVESPMWRDGIIHGPVIAKLCNNAFLRDSGYRPTALSTGHDVGYAVWGPLFFGFLTWVINKAQKEKHQNVFFLAREGWVLLRLYEQMRGALNGFVSLPQGKYLAVSRRAVMGPMAAVDFDPKFILRGSAFRGTVHELLKARLGIEIDTDVVGLTMHIDTERDFAGAMALLNRLRKPIIAAASERLVNLRRYLAQEGVDRPESLIVDIGYSGTIQSALQAVSDVPLVGAYMVTSPTVSSVRATGGRASGYFSNEHSPSTVLDYSMLLEAIMTAPDGQTVDYKQVGNQIQPVFGKLGDAQHYFSYLEEQFEGASAYIADLLATYGPEVLMTTYSPRECEAGLRQLAEGVLRPPREFWTKLNVENNFCGEGEVDIGQFYRLGRV